MDVPDLTRWLMGRSFAAWRQDFDEQGYIVLPDVLTPDEIQALRTALAPWLERDRKGRNHFEGHATNRVYGMLAKSPLFADLVTHPLALAFAEADLGESCLLSACLAINLHPGETVQPWHHDDAHLTLPRPRPSCGVSTFWAIDATTAENGATQVIAGSHRWGPEGPGDGLRHAFGDPTASPDPEHHPDAVSVALSAGSLMVAKGTLWHRGGANQTDQPRLVITPQYCPGWMRPLESMMAVVPRETAAHLSKRAQELIGYSIHPPFMGYADGIHPGKLLPSVP
ncbi:MAG: phytanoyl-CoA dioxygenase family protein [Myxococcota bacterium]